jgi:hypothetical protein
VTPRFHEGILGQILGRVGIAREACAESDEPIALLRERDRGIGLIPIPILSTHDLHPSPTGVQAIPYLTIHIYIDIAHLPGKTTHFLTQIGNHQKVQSGEGWESL